MRAIVDKDLRSVPADAAKGACVSVLPSRTEIDASLMARVCASRDRDALNLLALHYGPRIKAWLMNRGEQAHTAEDIVQDVLVAVWIKSELFDPARGSFSTWAYRMARNRWIDLKRKHHRTHTKDFDEISRLADSAVQSADVDYEKNQAAKAVQLELATLTPEQKHILHLAFFEGLTHSQIAVRTGLPLGTVKSRIRAPLKKMQTGLREYSELYDD